jgi:hypothetical protein
MRWVVGIDEAGYGPNLGPLAQAAVAMRLPDDDPDGWALLRPHARRRSEPADDRVLVDDSKLVYAGNGGLARLERGVAAVLGLPAGPLRDWLAAVTTHHVLAELAAECWFDGTEAIPLHPDPPEPLGLDARLVGVRLVPASVFNKIVAGSGSKATVLAIGLGSLLAAVREALPPGEPLHIVCDKHGGRNCYAALLQGAFHDGWVVTELEGADESRYRVESLDREVRVVFRPRADADSAAVALASMACKYLREICMRQFNRFWSGHVPDLKPTAGYPGDSRRYYDAIRPAMDRLGLCEDAVWRGR